MDRALLSLKGILTTVSVLGFLDFEVSLIVKIDTFIYLLVAF